MGRYEEYNMSLESIFLLTPGDCEAQAAEAISGYEEEIIQMLEKATQADWEYYTGNLHEQAFTEIVILVIFHKKLIN